MFHTIIIISHVLLAVVMILLILLQHGKGASAGAAFGAGASGTVFGAQGSASFLSRTTAVLASFFFLTSLTLAYLSGKSPETTSILEAQESVLSGDDGFSDLLPADGESDLPSLPLDNPLLAPDVEQPASTESPDDNK